MRRKENKSNVGLEISNALFPPLLLLLLCKRVDGELLLEEYRECECHVDDGLVDNADGGGARPMHFGKAVEKQSAEMIATARVVRDR